MKHAAFVLGRHHELPDDAADHLARFDLVVWGNRTHLERPGLIESVYGKNRRAIHLMFYSWMNALDLTAWTATMRAGHGNTFDGELGRSLHFMGAWTRDGEGDPVSTWPGCWTPAIESIDYARLFHNTVLRTLPAMPWLGVFVDMAIDGAIGTAASAYTHGPWVTSALHHALSTLRVSLGDHAPIVVNGACQHYGVLNGREFENYDGRALDVQYRRAPSIYVVHSSDDRGNRVQAQDAALAFGCYHHHTTAWDEATNWEWVWD